MSRASSSSAALYYNKAEIVATFPAVWSQTKGGLIYRIWSLKNNYRQQSNRNIKLNFNKPHNAPNIAPFPVERLAELLLTAHF